MSVYSKKKTVPQTSETGFRPVLRKVQNMVRLNLKNWFGLGALIGLPGPLSNAWTLNHAELSE